MKKKITIEGMGCGSCVAHINDALKGICGVKAVEVNLAEKNAIVELEHDVADEKLTTAVNDAGYNVVEVINL